MRFHSPLVEWCTTWASDVKFSHWWLQQIISLKKQEQKFVCDYSGTENKGHGDLWTVVAVHLKEELFKSGKSCQKTRDLLFPTSFCSSVQRLHLKQRKKSWLIGRLSYAFFPPSSSLIKYAGMVIPFYLTEACFKPTVVCGGFWIMFHFEEILVIDCILKHFVLSQMFHANNSDLWSNFFSLLPGVLISQLLFIRQKRKRGRSNQCSEVVTDLTGILRVTVSSGLSSMKAVFWAASCIIPLHEFYKT